MALDLDGDGDISTKELDSLLRSVKRKLRMTDREITKLVEQTDKDGDGTVDLEEFLNMIEKGKVKNRKEIILKALIQRAGLRKEFERYDKDGSGTISRDEFKSILEHKYQSSLSVEEVDKLMDEADNDKSGQIDYEEFLKVFSDFTINKKIPNIKL